MIGERLRKGAVIVTAVLICLAGNPVPSPAGAGPKLIVFHAGSLAVPFKEMSEAFKVKHPGVEVIREAAGSRTCARKVADLGLPCDVMASADYTVIDKLLIPEHASWNISFATNEMGIMYRPDSKFAKEINETNWYRILLRKGVAFGHSDPNSDPCGYRTMLVWQLAERHYGVPGLFKSLQAACPPRNVRPKETDLMALLEAGEIDYLFIYRSVCLQHHMPLVKLPDAVNLGSAQYADFYRQAAIRISGKTPGTFVVKKGKPMVYGITIPNKAPHRKLAVEFVAFVLGPEGRKIMARNGQAPVSPPRATGRVDQLPAVLKSMVR